jgi:hypothetical protein
VLRLREAPHREAVFGAHFQGHGHEFALLPVLDEQQVRATERRLAVRLPEEYRTFLMEVGAGGAGPDYGILPVWRPGPDTRPAIDHGARPFRPELTAELDRLESTEPRRSEHPDQASFTAAYATWQARCDELYDALTEGTLCISSQGCGYYSLLVVTGPLRGTVWEDVRAVGEGVVPVTRHGEQRPVSFRDWYLHWLDNAERHAWNPPPGPRLITDP